MKTAERGNRDAGGRILTRTATLQPGSTGLRLPGKELKPMSFNRATHCLDLAEVLQIVQALERDSRGEQKADSQSKKSNGRPNPGYSAVTSSAATSLSRKRVCKTAPRWRRRQRAHR